MAYQKVLIAGQWRDPKNPAGCFNAVNPANKQILAEMYPVSGQDDVNEAIFAGKQIHDRSRPDPDSRF